MRFQNMMVVTLVAMAAATTAHAGAVQGAVQKIGSIQIDLGDDGSRDYDLDVSGLLSFDASTGDVKLNAPTGSVSDATGRWFTSQFTVNGKTYSGVGWHSWQTVDGTVDMTGSGTPTSSSNPWASSLVLAMNGNVDPEMSYGFSIRNNTAATQAYTVTFGESLVPTVAGAYTLSADISGAVSSVPSSAGVTVTPNTSSGMVQELYLRKVSDGSFVNAGVNVGTSFAVASSGSVPYPSDTAFVNNGNTGADAYNYWEFRTKFKLSGGKDTFVATGSAVLTPVPEPESYALVLAGALVMVSVARRRRPV